MQSTPRRLACAETWASNKETASRIRIQIAQEVPSPPGSPRPSVPCRATHGPSNEGPEIRGDGHVSAALDETRSRWSTVC